MLDRSLLRLLLLSFLALALSACSFSLAEDIVPPPNAIQPVSMPTEPPATGPVYPVVPPDPAAGKAIFLEKCAPCHGELGLGDGPRASQLSVPVAAIGLPEVARQATPVRWFTIVTEGNLERFMPPFPSLDDRQRWDVVAYALTLSEKAGELAQGEKLYMEYCLSCHGAQGKGDGPQAASLSAIPVSFKDQSYLSERSAEDLFQAISNGKGEMPGFVDKLSESDRRALVTYSRSLSFAGAGDEVIVAAPTAAPGETITSSITSTLPLSATATTGMVQVQVSNGSGTALPEDLSATVYAFDNMQFAISYTQSTQENGLFTFDGIDFPAGRAFIASVTYKGAEYSSDVGVVDNPNQPVSLPVTIYEPTSDPSGLTVDRLHLFFDFSQPGLVQVVEMFIVSNPTPQAVVAEEPGGPVLAYLLPEGASNLQFEDSVLGERYVEIPGGFADTRSIPPGSGHYQLIFAFNMPYDKKLKFSQPLNLGVNATVVMLPDVGVKVKSDGLADAGSRDVEGVSYKMYNGQSLQSGSLLELELSGSPKGSSSLQSSTTTRNSLLIGIGALGLVLIVVGLYFYNRNREAAAVTEEGEAEAKIELANGDPGTLMDAIIALDDLFREGKLPEDAYRTRRQELKTRLEKQMQS